MPSCRHFLLIEFVREHPLRILLLTELLLSENRVILSSAVLSQYTRVTDERQYIMIIAELCDAKNVYKCANHHGSLVTLFFAYRGSS